MKGIKILLLTIVLVLFSCINVNATDAFLVDVFPSFSPTQGAVNTFEHYTYDLNQVYREGDSLYFYSLITNNTKEITNISVEALLFDSDMKNIGIFNYCSSKDYETEFANYKLQPKEKVTFKYKIYPKCLGDSENNTLSDVAYYAIITDNEYCKIGGYDKYLGKTIEEIVLIKDAGPSGSKFDSIMSTINRYIPIDGIDVGAGVGIIIGIVLIIVGIAIWVAFGAFLNKLHDRMYNKTTVLAYVPITNIYLCVKMAFGKIIGFSYLGVAFLGGVLGVIGIGFVTVIANLVLFVAFVLDIIKLVTGKYELCYLDVSNNNVIIDNVNNNSGDDNQQINNNQNQTNEYGYSQDNNVKESLLGVDSNPDLEDDNTMEVNTGGNNHNNQNNNSEESDLSRFFR